MNLPKLADIIEKNKHKFIDKLDDLALPEWRCCE